ncbi:KilA-N domain-containing protein [Formosimonas limnophila]|nr:KilA-N domain-containing protein [Formosimonas limnophila]
MASLSKFQKSKRVSTKESGILEVQGVEIHVLEREDEDYISLTDMTASFDGGSGLIEAWLRNKNTIEFLGAAKSEEQFFIEV